MAYRVLSNKKNRSVTLHFSASNSSLIVAGNTTTSNVATSDETLTGAYIKSISWGCDTGSAQVFRGSNLVSTHTQSGSIDYAMLETPINLDPAANLDVKFVGSANSYCIIKLQKIGGGTSEYLKG